jgi:hypothetical protein
MKLASPFLMLLILAAACAFAQQTAQPNATTPDSGPATDQTAPTSAEPQTAPAPAQPNSQDAKDTTIRGCLEAGNDHNYTVTDKNGIRYTLIGMDASSLSSHVGEEVEADGEATAGSDAAAGPGPSTEKPASSPTQMFKVNDVRKVSDKCTM